MFTPSCLESNCLSAESAPAVSHAPTSASLSSPHWPWLDFSTLISLLSHAGLDSSLSAPVFWSLICSFFGAAFRHEIASAGVIRSRRAGAVGRAGMGRVDAQPDPDQGKSVE